MSSVEHQIETLCPNEPGENVSHRVGDNNARSELSVGDRALPRAGFKLPRNHKLMSAVEAHLAIYGPEGPPFGELGRKSRFAKVNAWLADHGRTTVSMSTINRAEDWLEEHTASIHSASS
jgi:hypothetical protein